MPAQGQIADRSSTLPFIPSDVALPKSLLAGKTRVTVKFQAHPGNTAGGLFELRILAAD